MLIGVFVNEELDLWWFFGVGVWVVSVVWFVVLGFSVGWL